MWRYMLITFIPLRDAFALRLRLLHACPHVPPWNHSNRHQPIASRLPWFRGNGSRLGRRRQVVGGSPKLQLRFGLGLVSATYRRALSWSGGGNTQSPAFSFLPNLRPACG